MYNKWYKIKGSDRENNIILYFFTEFVFFIGYVSFLYNRKCIPLDHFIYSYKSENAVLIIKFLVISVIIFTETSLNTKSCNYNYTR